MLDHFCEEIAMLQQSVGLGLSPSPPVAPKGQHLHQVLCPNAIATSCNTNDHPLVTEMYVLDSCEIPAFCTNPCKWLPLLAQIIESTLW
jgi:hypothetical protein